MRWAKIVEGDSLPPPTEGGSGKSRGQCTEHNCSAALGPGVAGRLRPVGPILPPARLLGLSPLSPLLQLLQGGTPPSGQGPPSETALKASLPLVSGCGFLPWTECLGSHHPHAGGAHEAASHLPPGTRPRGEVPPQVSRAQGGLEAAKETLARPKQRERTPAC